MGKTVTFESKGDWRKTMNFLKRAEKINYSMLETYGQLGVEALAEATPKDSGKTAASWYYVINETSKGLSLEWHNSNLANGWCPIAVILQYGHATGGGGWVEGIDYINPAIRPIFDAIANTLWKEVTKS